MSIICNTRCLNAPLTGTQRYTQKILSAFPSKVDQIDPGITLSRGMKGHLWEQFVLPTKLKNRLLWSPSNSGPISVKHQVVTIHDVVAVDHPEWFSKNFVKWYNYILPRLCKNAEHIIAISEFTKQRLIDIYAVPDSKISMIYNGIDQVPAVYDAADGSAFDVPFERYVLSLGSLEPRKNIPLLLKAWRNLLPNLPDDVGLVVVGGTGNKKIFKDAGISDLPDRVFFTGHVKDQYITQLYKNALFFVYLSVYEGFGLPPLEAMALGTPVLTGNRTALPEVVGDGGLLVDPYSLAECEAGMLKLISDADLRHKLSEKAQQQVLKFDWAKTGKQTWDVLQKFD